MISCEKEEKSLYCRYCSFSLTPSCSVEVFSQVRKPLFSLSFSQAVLNPDSLNKAQNYALGFYSPDSTFQKISSGHCCSMKQTKQTCSLIKKYSRAEGEKPQTKSNQPKPKRPNQPKAEFLNLHSFYANYETTFNSLDCIFAANGPTNSKRPLQCCYQVLGVRAALMRF